MTEGKAPALSTVGVATDQDADDLVLGLSLLSTSGGGWPSRGREYLKALLEEGFEILWSPISAISPETLACSAFGMGSTAPRGPMSDVERREYGVSEYVYHRPAVRAIEQLSRHVGPIEAIVPFELGGFNTVVGIDAAVRMGLPLIDGDLCGRAVPEMSQALPATMGANPWPLTICDQWGNSLLLDDCPSPIVAERIGKMVSTVSKRPDVLATCAHAAFPMSAGELMTKMVPGTLSLSLDIGRAVARANQIGGDGPLAAATAMGGSIMFSGRVTDRDWVDEDGYQVGTTVIEGTDRDDGHVAKVWFKNENHILWRDDQVVVTSPDLITVVLRDDASPQINTELEVGAHVSVLARAAHPAYRSGPPLEATEPRHYGLDIDYVPLAIES